MNMKFKWILIWSARFMTTRRPYVARTFATIFTIGSVTTCKSFMVPRPRRLMKCITFARVSR